MLCERAYSALLDAFPYDLLPQLWDAWASACWALCETAHSALGF